MQRGLISGVSYPSFKSVTYCVSLSTYLNFSMPYLPHLQNGDNIIHFIGAVIEIDQENKDKVSGLLTAPLKDCFLSSVFLNSCDTHQCLHSGRLDWPLNHPPGPWGKGHAACCAVIINCLNALGLVCLPNNDLLTKQQWLCRSVANSHCCLGTA